ncbi:MAG: DNA repair protein RecN [Pyrinomonadaceae bacterium]
MLKSLQISNVALIDDLTVDFSDGFNALTGETGSGKSIIIDALALTVGGRSTVTLIRTGAETAVVTALFDLPDTAEVRESLAQTGNDASEPVDAHFELLIRREFGRNGRQRVTVNGQLSTIAILKQLQPLLVDIHGQGEQQTLFNPATHLDLMDTFLGLAAPREDMAQAYSALNKLERQLAELSSEFDPAVMEALEHERDELTQAELTGDEQNALEQEKRLLLNTERLSQLATSALQELYDFEDSALVRLTRASKFIGELGSFDAALANHATELTSAVALVDDVTQSVRTFLAALEFSAIRLDQIENRLAEIARITRPFGGTIAAALEHLADLEKRIAARADAAGAAKQLSQEIELAAKAADKIAARLHQARERGRDKLIKRLIASLKELGFPHAVLVIEILPLTDAAGEPRLSARGSDQIEFHFSANKGEAPRKLAEVASGGEASRLMLALKTISQPADFPRTVVFDEIDSGIGGGISTAVGRHLKKLAAVNQVFSVTHQPQIASFADQHLTVEKQVKRNRTLITLRALAADDRVEEIARMLAGGEINASAREHARQLVKEAKA